MQVTKKIKVAFFDAAVAFGGSAVVLAHLFNHIDRDRFEPMLVTGLDSESISTLFRPEDVFSRYRRLLTYVDRSRWMLACPLQAGWFRKLWAYSFSLAEGVCNFLPFCYLAFRFVLNRPDVVHDNNDRFAGKLAGLLNIPLVCHLHGVPSAADLQRPEVKRAQCYVAISDYVARECIARGMAAERTEVIYNPAPQFQPDLTKRWPYLATLGVKEGAIVFGHFGRLVRWKGQMEFLVAFQRAFAARNDVVALIVGDDVEGYASDYRQSLEQYVTENGLAGRVVFTGHSSDVLNVMSCCDVVVHSSIEPEPFGLVITEAMAAGAAVIGARLGAPIEIIEEGVTGLLADPFNTDELADALTLLAEDQVRRTMIAKAGQEMVKDRYSPQRFARQMEAVYQRVAKKNCSKS